MTDKKKKNKIADILLDFYDEYDSNVINRPMIPNIYAGKILDSMQEEPKECMYSKGNYTDEDRKILCDGCEENCKYNKKETVNDKLGGINNALVQDRIITSEPIGVPADSIELVSIPDKKEPTIPDIVDEHYWEMFGEEPVSEDLEKAATEYVKGSLVGSPSVKKNAFKAGAKWQKEQMIAKAINAVVSQVPCSNEIILYNPASVHWSYLPQEMNKLGLSKGDKIKLIIIKED